MGAKVEVNPASSLSLRIRGELEIAGILGCHIALFFATFIDYPIGPRSRTLLLTESIAGGSSSSSAVPRHRRGTAYGISRTLNGGDAVSFCSPWSTALVG